MKKIIIAIGMLIAIILLTIFTIPNNENPVKSIKSE